MKMLKNKNLTQKIIIAIIIVLSFNFITPNYSQADFGGILLGPVIDLIAGLGDSVMALLQVFMDGGENSVLKSEGFSIKSSDFRGNESDYGMEADSSSSTKEINADDLDQGWLGWGTYSIPLIKYSPEKIFANQVPALDANFINPTDWENTEQNDKSIARQLQETISSWYNALRNLVIVGLLSILVYVGIRMMLTSIASDKAKYKQMFMDWLIALCLVFFLHYVMSFTMTVTQMITDGISGGTDVNVTIKDSDGDITFKTNLTGLCRMQVQYKDLGERMVYLIFYIALVVYTFMFTWKYMKRAITMAFLTLMAPLVTLTYPIDKMGDGKAQAFNMWLKEYIFNALLQPFHLIIYTIFLGSAMNIAIENPLYAILFLAFITPAEKILRKFFGFDKATTAGASFAGAFGGAAAFNAMKSVMTKGAQKIGQGKGQGGNAGKGDKGIRQQGQITDPNAPDGGMDPFLVGAGAAASSADENDRTGSANQNADGIDYTRAQEAQRLREQGMSQDEIVAQLNQTLPFDRNTGSNTSEDDKRGFLQWKRDSAKEKWDDSAMKQRLENMQQKAANLPPIRYARAGGAKVRDLAGRASDKASSVYNSMPKPVRNSLEKAGKASIRTIKGAVGTMGHVGLGAAKFAGKAAVAGTVGAIGLGMGIAGDELEDTFKYGFTGATLGATAGPALASSVASGISATGSDIRSTYETHAYGAEEADLRQQARDFVNDQDNRDFFEARMTEATGSKPSRNELNQTMQVAAEYNNAGITNLKQINKSMKLEQELAKELQQSTGMTEQEVTKSARDQAMTIAKIANGIDAKDLRDKGKVEGLQDSFARELKSKDPTMSDQAAKAQASRIVAMVKKAKKVY